MRKITINGSCFKQIVISDHYKVTHDDLSDELILELVKTLEGAFRLPVDIDSDGFSYFVEDPVSLGSRMYRLIWCLPEDLAYLGVVNAFRVKEKKR